MSAPIDPAQPIAVRPVDATEVPTVIALVRDVLAEFGLEFGKGASTDDELARLPTSYRDPGGEFWVALRSTEIIGTCGVFPVAPGTFELRKMYLRPSSRGLGVGKTLFEVALSWTRSRGASRIVLDTTEQMHRAIAFYESHSFVRDDEQIRGTRCSRGYTLRLE